MANSNSLNNESIGEFSVLDAVGSSTKILEATSASASLGKSTAGYVTKMEAPTGGLVLKGAVGNATASSQQRILTVDSSTEICGSKIAKNILIQRKTFSSNSAFSTSASIPFDNTPPLFSEGDPLVSLNFTPLEADSVLEISFSSWATITGSGANGTVSLFEDGQGTDECIFANPLGATISGGTAELPVAFIFEKISGSTTQKNFSLRFGVGGVGSVAVNSSGGGAARYGGKGTLLFSIQEFSQ